MGNDHLIEQLGHFYTPLVSDICDELGLGDRLLPTDIQLVGNNPQTVVAGTAFCCQVVATDKYVEIDTILKMVDAIPKGSFVVVASDQDVDAALWGGLMSARALAKGAVAAAVTGPIRDVAQIDKLQFPVFAKGKNMRDIRRRGKMVAFGIDVTIGELGISTGDALLGDANGVIALPTNSLPNVLELLHRAECDEQAVQDGLTSGKSAVDMFESKGRF